MNWKFVYLEYVKLYHLDSLSLFQNVFVFDEQICEMLK